MVQVTAGTSAGSGAADIGKAEDAAHTSGDSGVMVLGYTHTGPTSSITDTNGDYGPIALSRVGAVMMCAPEYAGSAGSDGASVLMGFGRRDNTTTTGAPSPVAVTGFLFNGTNFDRPRGNTEQTVGITASGVTTTQTGTDQTNYNARGVIVVLDMTVVGTGSVTLSIQGKAPTSGKYYTLLAGAAVVTNSTNVYTIYPGNTVAANVSASTVLPRTWRCVVTANNANATTYTVEASLIL